jgi:peptide/nickel transport system permease protein
VIATFAATVFAFVCIQLAPGDPITALGEGVPEPVRERLRAIHGYDASLGTQFLRWLGALAQGDFGYSTSQQRPAIDVVLDALGNSLLLVLPGVALATVLGMMIGVWQAIHAGTRRDRVTAAVLFALYALPEFSLSLLVLLVFGVVWPVLPTGGLVSDTHDYLSAAARIGDRLRHLVLPVLVIAVVDTTAVARYQRRSMRDMLDQPFVRAAFGAGLPGRLVRWQAWRAALLPVLSLLGILLPLNLLGVVFIEQVFAWPGLGLTFYQAINARDYAVVAACVVVQGTVIAVCTLVVDLLREALDPRLRDAEEIGVSHAW